jgi:hypothetical protein
VEDLPNPEKLISLDINFQDLAVNMYYEGWKPVAYPLMEVDGVDAATTRYDGELDDPDHPRPRYIGEEPHTQLPLGAEVLRRDQPRPVKDNPQA